MKRTMVPHLLVTLSPLCLPARWQGLASVTNLSFNFHQGLSHSARADVVRVHVQNIRCTLYILYPWRDSNQGLLKPAHTCLCQSVCVRKNGVGDIFLTVANIFLTVRISWIPVISKYLLAGCGISVLLGTVRSMWPWPLFWLCYLWLEKWSGLLRERGGNERWERCERDLSFPGIVTTEWDMFWFDR